MKIKLENNTFVIDIMELMSELDPESKQQLIGALGVEELTKELITNIIATMTGEATTIMYEHWWNPQQHQHNLREAMIPLLPEVARKLVKVYAEDCANFQDTETHNRNLLRDLSIRIHHVIGTLSRDEEPNLENIERSLRDVSQKLILDYKSTTVSSELLKEFLDKVFADEAL